jgi:diadenosine tetraphosphate (Ap4A) HIT family hydrolase
MSQKVTRTCRTCLSLSGKEPLFPESLIYNGKYWVIEHAYPVKIKGWIVIILKRHCEALHELTESEFNELSILEEKVIKRLHAILKSEKEYSACFAEGKGFNHIHKHIIAKPHHLKQEFKGPAIFTLLGGEEKLALKTSILKLCQQISTTF